MEYAKIDDWLAWGRLVRAWASGFQPLPQTRADFIAQCAAAKVGLTLPDELKSVQFVQSGDDTLLVRLPTRSMANLVLGPDYKPPAFYFKYFTQTEEFDNDFRDGRIGDYSISQCG